MTRRNVGTPTHNVWPNISLSLEDDFWDLFRLRVMEHGCRPQDLVRHTDRTMRLLPDRGPGRNRTLSLSAAIRAYVLRTVMEENERLRASLRAGAERHSYRTRHYPAWSPIPDAPLPANVQRTREQRASLPRHVHP
jgi:hypothetical protein